MHNGLRAQQRAPVFPQCIGMASCVMSSGVITFLTFNGVIGSFVRNSAGSFTLSFSSPQPDTNYAVAATSSGDGVSEKAVFFEVAPTVNSFQVRVTTNPGGAPTECNIIQIAVFR